MREIERQGRRATFDRARRIARRLPYSRRAGCSSAASIAQLGGELRLFVSAGAYLPPELQRGLGGPRRRRAPGLRLDRVRAGVGEHRAGPSGRARSDGRCPGAAAPCRGHDRRSWWRDPRSPGLLAGSRGDGGRLREGRLVPHGRHRALRRAGPAGALGTHQEHHRAAQRPQRVSRGHRGRPPGPRAFASGGARDRAGTHRGGGPAAGQPAHRAPPGRGRASDPAASADAEDAPSGRRSTASSRPPTRASGSTSASTRWRLWPEPDFPRTHTLKIRRDEVRAWAGVDVPLQVQDVHEPEAAATRG